jgi:enoyl-CoA hydratase/carnithine racemase
MELTYMRYETRGPAAWIILDRPAVLNALTPEMIVDLRAAAAAARDDPDVRVVVFTGTGRGFCPGFDIGVMKDMDMGRAWDLATMMTEAWSFIRTLPKPTIAAINGVAAGGGFELSLVCDLRIAARTARIGSCEVRINQPTTNGSSYLLARLIGESKAKELCLTGDLFGAEEAARVGLVNAVAEPEDFEATVQEWADRIASRAPIAVAHVKRCFEEGRTITADAAVRMEEEAALNCMRTEDQMEGLTAFLEKRKPRWAGR